MEDSTRFTNSPRVHRHPHQQCQQHEQHKRHQREGSAQKVDLIDDECSTDSGCSSGGSTGSAERLSHRGSGERLCRSVRSPRSHGYLDRLRGRPTRSQERLSSVQRSCERTRAKSSRSWSPEDVRALEERESGEWSSYFASSTDAQSSSDSDSLRRPFTAETLRRAFQTFKISSKWENKEKKHTKKSPKRILRSPVSYTYVRGLSGLPTQRVPRNTAQQLVMPCSCQDSIGLYR